MIVKVCRHCGEEFEVKPGKMGYIDECVECLADLGIKEPACREKRIVRYATPEPSLTPLSSRTISKHKRKRALVEARTQFKRQKIDQSELRRRQELTHQFLERFPGKQGNLWGQ